MIRVLVTDGEQRAALAITRSLGRAGYLVHVCSQRRRSLAGASKYCREHQQVASALDYPDRFVADVAELCDRLSIDVLLPVTEESVLSVLGNRDRFGKVIVPFAPLPAFRAVSNKQDVLRAGAEVGLTAPPQWVVNDPPAMDAALAEVIEFPIVIKPARSVGEINGERVKLSVIHAKDSEQLGDRMTQLPAAAYPVLLQRRIVGPGVGIFLLVWDDQVRAIFAHRRLREKPPSGGVSVYCESVVADPVLVERATALLRKFNWQGVAMVELKIDDNTGQPYLMEVNGRFWGSLQLAIDAGVDFPRLLVECATGNPPASPPKFRIGVRTRWWWGDVDHLIARLRRSPAALALPPNAGTRMQAVRDFFKWRPRDHADVFRFNDPAPLFRETLDWFARR